MYKKTGIPLVVMLSISFLIITFFRESISNLESIIFIKQKFQITSENKRVQFFYFKNYDEPIFSSETELIRYLVKNSNSDSMKVHHIFHYTCKIFNYDFPYSQDTFLHRPLDFLYVYGYGYCDDAAAFFVNLCNKAGIEACVINFDVHVAAQAFYNGKWHYFDPSTQKFLKNKKGVALPIEEIMRNNKLINELYDGYGWSIYHNTFREALNGTIRDSCNKWYISNAQNPQLPNFIHQNAKIILSAYKDRINQSHLSNKESYKSGKGIYTYYSKINENNIYFQTQFRYETITFYFKQNIKHNASKLTINNRKMTDLDFDVQGKKVTYSFVKNELKKINQVEVRNLNNSIDSIALSFIFNAEYLLNDVFMPTLIDTNGNTIDGLLIRNLEK